MGYRGIKRSFPFRPKKAIAKWKAVSGVSGYQLYYKAKGVKAKTININNPKTLKKTVKNLKPGKTYTFKVRTITQIENLAEPGTSVIPGEWSKVMKIKARK